MTLRGYDDYEVSLGDELRGERACRGWSLRDAGRELCIKPAMIEAIENGDLSAFPNRSVVPGYVRSYARHLGLDDEVIYQRFCEESGFQSTLKTFGMTEARTGGSRSGATLSGPVGADFTASRFAVRPAPRRIGAAVSLGGLTSGLALVALIAGLGYGGWAVLQDIQRVGFVPLPEAPAVVADAPEIAGPDAVGPDLAFVARPAAAAYAEDGVLLGLAESEPVALPGRDGPIAAIDPEETGLVTRPALADAPVAAASAVPPAESLRLTDAASGLPPGLAPAGAPVGGGAAGPVADGDPDLGTALATVAAGNDGTVAVEATDTAWVRVRDGGGAVLFEGILNAGDRYELPDRADAAQLRAGNAGGVMIAVGGRRYGPLGRSGEVVKRIPLAAEAVVERYQPATVDDAAEAVSSTVATSAN